MKTEELKNALNEENLEQVVGGVDDGSPDNAGQIISDHVKKRKTPLCELRHQSASAIV